MHKRGRMIGRIVNYERHDDYYYYSYPTLNQEVVPPHYHCQKVLSLLGDVPLIYACIIKPKYLVSIALLSIYFSIIVIVNYVYVNYIYILLINKI